MQASSNHYGGNICEQKNGDLLKQLYGSIYPKELTPIIILEKSVTCHSASCCTNIRILYFTHVTQVLFVCKNMVVQDGCELRKQNLGQLLAFNENEYEDNIPADVLEFLSCIKKTKIKTAM